MSAKEFQELRKKYDTKHYNLLIDIERRCMKKDTRHIDKSESLLMFTKNQFVREFQRIIDKDESLTLKY